MKKIVINISDTLYEKFRLEAIERKKDVPQILADRLLSEPFSNSVEEAFEIWMQRQFDIICQTTI